MMFELNRESFESFVAVLRKEKGYTQKELAERLFISDKAVSKWERGLSMPDISLLIPLAELLEVSVTELLEGRRLTQMEELNQSQVESLVKKAIALSEEPPERKKKRRRKHAMIFGACILLLILELSGFWLLGVMGFGGQKEDSYGSEFFIWGSGMLVMELLSLFFGAYFWLFMKERLPAYYDENNISAYSDGLFRINLPGITFHNGNWPHIVKALRLWSVITMLTFPVINYLLVLFPVGFGVYFGIQNILLVLYLTGLFVPVYIVGKKYGRPEEKGQKEQREQKKQEEQEGQEEQKEQEGQEEQKEQEEQKGQKEQKEERKKKGILLGLFFVVLLGAVIYGSSTITTGFSGIRIGYTSSEGLRSWSASYQQLDGRLTKKLYPDIKEKEGESGVPYRIEIETIQGSLSMEITNEVGESIFSAEHMESGQYSVVLQGTVKVTIMAEKHRGSFMIQKSGES